MGSCAGGSYVEARRDSLVNASNAVISRDSIDKPRGLSLGRYLFSMVMHDGIAQINVDWTLPLS